MTPQNLNLMANGFYIASGICLAVGIYFFFNLHIIEVFNDLTGKTIAADQNSTSIANS